eukprot:CAMPEP_0195526302 /NCGR_PEP_ID=MMETSP0794_2-20130614/27288_1 /TAXON_ID=515487 /ORGANISM="Stephanopyxis turris, Strain CCMP 815" /LENGTH=277 /DNA_ID=CAMNT_0040656955 /DNA_START=52 /DNA_END=885 /DNA_ORIENTATION=+
MKRKAPSGQRRVSVLAFEKKGFQLTRNLPTLIDAFLAAAGAACSIVFLQMLGDAMHIPVYGSFLVSSALKLFMNIKPPSMKAFYQGTVFAIFAGTTLRFYRDTMGSHSNLVILFVCMIFFKLSGGIWGGAMSLTTFYAVESGDWDSFQDLPIRYIFFPWLSGHALLYASASALSVVRLRVRHHLFARQYFLVKETLVDSLSGDLRDEKLREAFDRFDTSGDGCLDVDEFRIALRSLLGVDLSLEDSQAILDMVDIDGNGILNFEDFSASVDGLLIRS